VIYVGLSRLTGESLTVDDHGHVLGPNKAAGGTVALSDTGIAWAAKYLPPVAARATAIQLISQTGRVTRTVAVLPGAVQSIFALGSLLYVAIPTALVVLR